MLKALLFDLDGTLADTDSLHQPTWTEALQPHGVGVDEEFYRQRISGRSNAEIVRELLPALSGDEGRAVFEAKEDSFRERATELAPLPGVVDFIEMGRRSGYKTALVTNAPREKRPRHTRGAGPVRRTSTKIFLSEEARCRQAGSGALHSGPGRDFGIAPDEALAFEDSTSGIVSAVAAGVPTVGIASTQKPEILREAGAFLVARDFTVSTIRKLISD